MNKDTAIQICGVCRAEVEALPAERQRRADWQRPARRNVRNLRALLHETARQGLPQVRAGETNWRHGDGHPPQMGGMLTLAGQNHGGRIMSHRIQIELCCCDESGGFERKVNSIELYAWTGKASVHLATLEHRFYPDFDDVTPVLFFASKNHKTDISPWNNAARWCQIGETWLKLSTVVAHGGNVFWLTFSTPTDYAAELINSLHQSQFKEWSWSSAVQWFADAWDGAGFPSPQLTAALEAECSGNDAPTPVIEPLRS